MQVINRILQVNGVSIQEALLHIQERDKRVPSRELVAKNGADGAPRLLSQS